MSRFFYIILLFSLNAFSEVNFISPFVKKINFTIDQGIVFNKLSEPPERIIREQLKYMFGILNEVDGGIDFLHLRIEIISNDLTTIHYQVSGELAWDRRREVPSSFLFLLPKFGDSNGLTEFLKKYQKDCARKASSLASFWNYYRPNKKGCLILDEDAVSVEADFSPIEQTNIEISPSYEKIFSDSVLESTIILTKDNPSIINDISVYDFQTLCGFPAVVECHPEIVINGVKVISHIFLVDNFGINPKEFFNKNYSYLKKSDFISYNGHSGMGANIESWMNDYPINDLNKHQLFFFNSCDTYGYFRNEFLKEGNRQVLLNATPNYFGTFATSNRNLINKILANADFNEILLSLPMEQRPLVLSR